MPLPTLRNVSWLHVPKCGSSFMNTMAGLCTRLPTCAHLGSFDSIGDFQTYYQPQAYCPSVFAPGRPLHSHSGIGAEPANMLQRTWLALMRQPEQRMVSAYRHKCHSYQPSAFPPPAPPSCKHLSANAYAKLTKGCMVKMLTRGGTSCGRPPPPSDDEVALAVRRLQQFAFVGIMEHWELSICLFHIKFGLGSCHRDELVNMRPGYDTKSKATMLRENRTRLQLFNSVPPEHNVTSWHMTETDQYDRVVYAAALDIFRRDLEAHGVTEARCLALSCTNPRAVRVSHSLV